LKEAFGDTADELAAVVELVAEKRPLPRFKTLRLERLNRWAVFHRFEEENDGEKCTEIVGGNIVGRSETEL